ncbi:MAG: SDR family NAD(P)-dependent oxidoreductase [Burkholderiales bacterium]
MTTPVQGTSSHARDELEGRVAVITGAAGGIGRALAHRMAQAGASVVLADRDDAGADVAAKIVADGGTARFVRTDITVEDDVGELVRATLAAHGRLDVLVNNAGIKGREAALTVLDAGEFAQVLAVNLTGTFLTMKHAIPAMLAGGGGTVVNNASVFGLVGFANHAAYAASKGGVVQLTRTAALEFAMRNVRVNCLCPGFVDTEMVSRAALAKMLVPQGRLGTVDEIAEMAVFLASDRAAYITGAVFAIDGGFTAR